MKVSVKVKPGSKKGRLVRPNLIDNSLEVFVPEPAHEGKANTAVIKLLAEYFSVSKSAVAIISGKTSRNKIIEIKSE